MTVKVMADRIKGSVYSQHPGIVMLKKIAENMKEKTGRDLNEWISFVKQKGPKAKKEQIAWLKKEHGLGGTNINLIVEYVEGNDPIGGYDPEALVEAQYAEKKSHLKPVYDQLLKMAFEAGIDVKACPGKTMVSFYRRHVFAELKATTNCRIDLGLALKGAENVPQRAIDTGGLAKGDRITHRIPISSLAEIDDEVKEWLQIAYNLDE